MNTSFLAQIIFAAAMCSFISCAVKENKTVPKKELQEEMRSTLVVPGKLDGATVEECAIIIVQALNQKYDEDPWSYSIEPHLMYNNVSGELFRSRKLYAEIPVEISVNDFLTFMQLAIDATYMLRGREVVFFGFR